jgi:hypothetical protein
MLNTVTSIYDFRCHDVFAHKRFIERDSRSAFRDYAKAVNKLFERVVTRNEREVAIAPLARFRVAFLARTFSKLARISLEKNV